MTSIQTSRVMIGSRLTPHNSYLRNFVKSLQTACIQAASRSEPDFAVAHQKMVLYTLQMLIACTGHRAVSDPFWNLDHFDLENGQVLIDDKSVDARQGSRLAWLPVSACRQVQLYLQHLRNLSRLVRKQHPQLADQIWAVTNADFPRPMPLFFFLELDGNSIGWTRILPGGLAAALEPLWVLPSNSNRHVLSTWLHEQQCSSELIDAQLGHSEAGCAPFGPVSPLAPDQVGQALRPLLEHFLDAYGWFEVNGLRAARRLPTCAPDPKSKILASPTMLGATARLTNREAQWRKDSEAIIALFQTTFLNYPPISINAEQLNALEEQIVTEGQRQGRVLVRLLLFRRHILKLRRSGTTTPLPGRLAIIKPERHSFTESALLQKRELDRLRNQFVRYLADREGSPLSLSQRVAELLISCIVFGAQTSQQFLSDLPRILSSSTWQAANSIFADVSSANSSPIRRWLPDRLSEALLIGYFDSDFHQTEIADPKALQGALNRDLIALLRELNAPIASRISDKFTSIDKLLAPLCQLAQAAWRLSLPGTISAYAAGEHGCASPPLSNWLRLVLGKAGSLPSVRPIEENRIVDEELTRIPRQNDERCIRKCGIQDWIALTKCFGDEKPTIAPNSEVLEKERDLTTKRSKARKNHFTKKIQALIQLKGENLSSVVGCLAAWGLHLCANGTRYTTNLKANSVSSYVRAIGAPLTELAYNRDFLGLSDILLEDLYRCVVESKSRKDQIYVVGRLREFHHFLQTKYGMPKIDWSDVADEDLLEADAIDAGIVTLSEFENALTIILDSPGIDERARCARATILILVYRFGLRTGEVFRLTVSDILCDAAEIILYVRNSIHGETKTDHGMRQLPLLGELSGRERQLLKRWLAYSQEYADSDPLALLFPEVDNKRQGIDRTTIVASLAVALRLACGDENIRLRHLRHTCASRLFLAMHCLKVSDNMIGRLYQALWGNNPPEAIRLKLIGDPEISRRGLYAVSMYMGHASPRTTLRHYTHCADLVLKSHLDEVTVKLSDRALAYCYQVNYANLRQMRSRLQTTTGAGILEETLACNARVPRPDFEEKVLESTVQNIEPPSRTLEPADLDRLLTVVTMRGTIEGLADRFLCSDYVVFEAINEAIQLQELHGYTDFGLASRSIDDYWEIPDNLRRATLDKDSGRVHRFLKDSSRNEAHVKALCAISEVWANSFLPHSTALLIARKSDLTKIVSSWNKLGMDTGYLEAILPKARKHQESVKFNQHERALKEMGFRVRTASRLPMRKVPEVPQNRVGLILVPSASHRLGYQATLNRVLFVMTAWRNLLQRNGFPYVQLDGTGFRSK